MTALRESMTDEELAAQSQSATGFGRWSQTDMLLARVGDEIAFTRYVLEAVNTPSDGKRPTVPEPMPRPGVKATSNAPSAAALDYLQALRDNRGATLNG